MIIVEDFHKAYDDTIAVTGLSFTVSPGQILGLVGPNGAGKTTTFRTLSCLLTPSRGRLTIDGCDVTDDPIAVKRRLAYIADDPQLFNDLTVEEHLAFVASAFDVDNASAKAQRLLWDFDLTKKRHAPAGDLSRGMRQKLAIICAYLRDPRALLFDEPLTGLDPHGIRMLKQTIRERADAGAAVIISSHLLAMVEDLCTHVLILNSGRQRFAGSVEDLRAAFVTEDDRLTLEHIFFMATDTSATTDAPGELAR
ncbi:MAG: ABC transporter ATP-binding protein [Planctomycetaceae bacterium]|nr:ABC transporter ATP-binding protein [Planctomycetaceae bacterium]